MYTDLEVFHYNTESCRKDPRPSEHQEECILTLKSFITKLSHRGSKDPGPSQHQGECILTLKSSITILSHIGTQASESHHPQEKWLFLNEIGKKRLFQVTIIYSEYNCQVLQNIWTIRIFATRRRQKVKYYILAGGNSTKINRALGKVSKCVFYYSLTHHVCLWAWMLANIFFKLKNCENVGAATWWELFFLV